ncbi:MAG: hypothetical protein EGP77_02860 [Lachnospiraceae bacterium]|nr:hypothetical protein [Lachnospiraceae bacterium]
MIVSNSFRLLKKAARYTIFHSITRCFKKGKTDRSVLVAEELSIRRTAASNIYNCGAGIKLTADILGHESLDSTTHYVRVDFTALREICHEWLGKCSSLSRPQSMFQHLILRHNVFKANSTAMHTTDRNPTFIQRMKC